MNRISMTCEEAKLIFAGYSKLELSTMDHAKHLYKKIFELHEQKEFSWTDEMSDEMKEFMGLVIRWQSVKKYLIENWVDHGHDRPDFMQDSVMDEIDNLTEFAMEKIAIMSLLDMQKRKHDATKNDKNNEFDLEW